MNESHWLSELLTPVNIVGSLLAALLTAWNTILRMKLAKLSGRIKENKEDFDKYVEKQEAKDLEQDRQRIRVERKINNLIVDMERRMTTQEARTDHLMPIVERRLRPRDPPPTEPETMRP